MIVFYRGLYLARLATLAMVLACGAAPVAAQSVALVTDVSGQVTGDGPVSILSEIRADAQIKLDGSARLVAMYLKSGDEYTFTGPAQIQFGAAEPQVIHGNKAQKRANPLGRGSHVSIRPVNVAQAAFVMRGSSPTARIKLLSLSGTRTLDTPPEFRWQAVEPGVKYRFELIDDTGRLLYEADVEATSLKLPASVKLRESASYTWEVTAHLPDKRKYLSSGDFSIASADLRAQAGKLRPAASAPVSERVAYAAWLEQMELKDEARKYWLALSAERPGDARLKELATQ